MPRVSERNLSPETGLNFRAPMLFLIWDHRQRYNLHMCARKPWAMFPWCRESFQPSHTQLKLYEVSEKCSWGFGYLQHAANERKRLFPVDGSSGPQHSWSFEKYPFLVWNGSDSLIINCRFPRKEIVTHNASDSCCVHIQIYCVHTQIIKGIHSGFTPRSLWRVQWPI